MQSYSQDLRDRVLWALEQGERPSAIARRLEVSRVWVYRVCGREQKTGQRSSFQIGGHRRSRIAEMESVLRAWIEKEPGLSLAELCQRLVAQGVLIKIGALCVRPGVKEHHLCRFDEQRPHRRGRGEKLYRSFYM